MPPGPGPVQVEMVVVVVDIGVKVGGKIAERGLRDRCGRWEVLVGLHESHILCQVDDLLSEISYVCY